VTVVTGVRLLYPGDWTSQQAAATVELARVQNYEPTTNGDGLSRGEAFVQVLMVPLDENTDYASRIETTEQITVGGLTGIRGTRATPDLIRLPGYDIYLPVYDQLFICA